VASGVARVPFPFLPRQLTLISALTIGIPGFFLALAPDAPTTPPGFIRRIATFAVPAGTVAAAATFGAYAIALQHHGANVTEARTTATMVLGLIGLWVVDVLARPLNLWREALLATLAVTGVASVASAPLRQFWDFKIPSTLILAQAATMAAVAIAAIELGWRFGRSIARVK
jgi:cation-transporting P-type ATPase E